MALLRRIALILTSVAAMTAGAATVNSPASAATTVLRGCSTGGTVTSGASQIPCPELKAPADNTDDAVKDLVLRWKPVASANLYQVEISPNKDWTNNTVELDDDGKTIATLFEVPAMLPHATYYWRVRAQVGNAWSGYSLPRQFLREWEAPISIQHPPTATDPTLTWAPVRSASEYQVIYLPKKTGESAQAWKSRLERELLDPTSGCFTAGTSFTPDYDIAEISSQAIVPACATQNLDVGKDYLWGVSAWDDTSASPVPSQTRHLGCGGEQQPPECDASVATGGPFTAAAPTGGSTTLTDEDLATSWHNTFGTEAACTDTASCPMTPTFSWQPVTGASNYVLRVYLDRDATNVYASYVTTHPRFTPTNAFPDAQPGRPYWWDVEADTCGGPGVTCTAPQAAVQNCPEAPTETADTPPTFTGTSVSPAGPEGSQSMQGGTTATVTLTGTGLQSGACVKASGGVVTSAPAVSAGKMTFTFWAPVAGGNVTFTAINPDGASSGPSPAVSVDSSTTALALSARKSFDKRSGKIHLVAPAPDATKHGRAFTFRWDDYLANGSRDSYDVKNYRLEVSGDDTFTDPVLKFDDIDLTQYTDPSGKLTDGHYFWRVAAIDQSGNLLTWSSTREFSVNATAPLVSIGTKSGVGTRHPLRIKLSEVIHGVTARTVKIVPDGEPVSKALPGTIRLGAGPKLYVFTPKRPYATGGVYKLWVRRTLTDANGNRAQVTGEPIRIKTTATNRSNGWRYSNGWSRSRASGALSGSFVSATPGHSARLRVAGSAVRLFACKGPNMGSIRISVAGHSHTLSLKQSFTRCGVDVWHRAIPSGIHRLTISVSSGVGNFDQVKVT